MPVLVWLARVIRSTFVWAINAVLSLGLFLLSAHLFAVADADAEPPAYILRGIAAIWLFAATWHFLKYGVLQRPKPVPSQEKRKIGNKEGALATLGCLAMIGAIIVVALVVGPWADWVYAGLTSADPSHPARQAVTDAGLLAERVAEHPDAYLPVAIAGIVGLIVLRVITAVASGAQRRRQRDDGSIRRPTPRQRQRQAGTTPASTTAPRTAPVPSARPVSPGQGSGTSGVPRATSPPRGLSRSGRTLVEPMLGTFRRDDDAGGWRLQNPRPQVGELLIKAGDEPSDSQLTAAYAIVQRTFEVLLRASEAAAPAAQARGVGLPRFAIVESIVGDDERTPRVTVRLKCDADAGRVYEVTSTDGMQTFTG